VIGVNLHVRHGCVKHRFINCPSRCLELRMVMLTSILTTYSPRVRSLRENLKLRPCRIAWSIRQGRGLTFSCKDRLRYEVNKLFIMWLLTLVLQSACGHCERIVPYNWLIRALVIWATDTSHDVATLIIVSHDCFYFNFPFSQFISPTSYQFETFIRLLPLCCVKYTYSILPIVQFTCQNRQ